MSREVLVAFDFGRDAVTVQSRIGPHAGPELAWEAPEALADGPAFCTTEDGRALILEALAIVHFPKVDTLVLALPAAQAETHRAELQQAWQGAHDVRNTECRSQRLTVNVRNVSVVARDQRD
jgi:hypothetical protein